MQLKVVVKCGKAESKFRIPCGNGQKTFKWLGLVAAGRYGAEAPGGGLRQRESRQAQRAGTALVPSAAARSSDERAGRGRRPPPTIERKSMARSSRGGSRGAGRVFVVVAAAPRGATWIFRRARRGGDAGLEGDPSASGRRADREP